MRMRLLCIVFFCSVYPFLQANAQSNEPFPNLVPSYVNYYYEEDISYSKKCFEDLFQDEQGRLWLKPCGVERLINSIGLFQFDGYLFYPVEVFSAGGKVLESPLFKGFGPGGELIGLVEERSLFSMDPDTRKSKIVETADETFSGTEIRGVYANAEETYVMGEKNGQTALFQLKDDVLILDRSFETSPGFWKGEYDMVVNDEEVWMVGDTLPIYQFDRRTKALNSFDVKDFPGHSLNAVFNSRGKLRQTPKLVKSTNGGVYLFLPDSPSNLLYELDREKGQFLPVKETFFDGLEIAGIFQDESDNICFLFRNADGAYRAILETADGRRFDYSRVVENHRNLLKLKGKDFLSQVFLLTQEGFYSVGIRDREMIRQVLNGKWVSSMVTLADGRLLINTIGEGWFVYDSKNESTTAYRGVDCTTTSPAFGKGMKQQIIPDTTGNLWFISQEHLIKYQAGSNECYAYDLGSKGNLFEFVNEDLVIVNHRRANILFYDIRAEQPVSLGRGIPTLLTGFIRDIMRDSDGIIWIPTNNGLWKMDIEKEQSELLGLEQGFTDFRFTAIYEGAGGQLWLGTYFGGLHRFDPRTGEVMIIDQGRGLSNNSVMGIISDSDGDLWVSTEYGINIVSPQGEVMHSIYKEDGLSYESFERFDPHKGKDGRLYFGSRNGISIIDPSLIKAHLKKDNKVQVYPIELRYFDKRKDKEVVRKEGLNRLERLDISAERPYLNIKFGLSSYLEPHKNNYAYMLEGKDKDWHYLGTQPELNIGRLPPGKYRLLINGADFRNNWSEEPLAIKIRARQFFYKQAWFYVLLGLPFVAFALLWARNKQLEARRLEKEVALRTKKIREDKSLIEKQAAELRKLDEMKSRFFTNISHELRTPITLIKAPLENFIHKYSTVLSEGMSRSLNLVLSNSAKLGKLVEELLELSSLEAKKATLKETPTPLKIFCRQLFSAYESGAALKDIQYVFDSDLEEEAHFLVDRNRLEKVINNLLSNALKFTPKGGTVRMSVRKRQNQLFIEVADSGRGIPPEDIPHLFDRYFQTRREEIVTEGGTGIGLALSRELAHLMKGELSVKSEWGSGACFLLRFPAKESQPKMNEPAIMISGALFVEESVPKQPTTTVPAQNGPRSKILIVEDNPDMQQLLQTLLTDLYDCIIAGNGLEAWTWLQEENDSVKDIELIISDVMMPKMDGYTLLEKIKADENWQRLPVIMLTARSAEEDKLQALRMGVDDYLLKPFSPAELKARLKNLIANYQVRKESLNRAEHPAGNIKVEFDSEVVPANQIWLKEVQEAAKEALELGIKLNTVLLAEKVFLSERQFSRNLKKLTGLTPNEYIQEVKLQKARHLLENRVYTTVSEVAQACGYSSGGYLTKIFQDRFGKKPGDYF